MKARDRFLRCISFVPVGMLFSGISVVATAGGEVQEIGDVVVITVGGGAKKRESVDYANAKPMPLPKSSKANTSYSRLKSRVSGFSSGDNGDGRLFEETISAPNSSVSSLQSPDEVKPAEYGTKKQPFSTARADLYDLKASLAYPYRASGKLFFNKSEGSFVCSASLIKPGVVVTAAHCVSEYGKNRFYSGFKYVPSYYLGDQGAVAPYGVWDWSHIFVMGNYLKGKGCSAGIVCESDVAVIVLESKRDPVYAGYSTGWLGYGWNKYGFAGTKTQITQIGYPGCLDDGQLMIRNDSQGVITSAYKNNTIIGSLMCGGSSGGPWLVNFGQRPQLTDTAEGLAAAPNTVVGVTSWGWIDKARKEQGASPFTSSNIVPLVEAACQARPLACGG